MDQTNCNANHTAYGHHHAGRTSVMARKLDPISSDRIIDTARAHHRAEFYIRAKNHMEM